MAVKVMVASAIAKGVARGGPARAAAPAETARPRRRRSSVYDADGNEVFITLMCLKCHKMRPLSQFGLRKMADGAIRNQPWCRTCRSGAGTKKDKSVEVEAEVEVAQVQAAEAQADTLESPAVARAEAPADEAPLLEASAPLPV